MCLSSILTPRKFRGVGDVSKQNGSPGKKVTVSLAIRMVAATFGRTVYCILDITLSVDVAGAGALTLNFFGLVGPITVVRTLPWLPAESGDFRAFAIHFSTDLQFGVGLTPGSPVRMYTCDSVPLE